MRFIGRLITVAGFLALSIVAFNNFAPVTETRVGQPEKEYVYIDGKPYPKNARGIYYVNGVPTFIKKGQPAVQVAPSPKVGPAADLIDDDGNIKPTVQ